MPRKTFKKKTYKRKVYKKKSYRRVPRGVSGIVSGLPRQRSTVLSYVEHVAALTSTSGVLGSYMFRCNSCYDPNYTFSGHQPMGWDTWTSLYNQYIVTASSINIKVLANQANTAPCAIGCYVTDGTAVGYTTPSEFIEAKRGTYRIFNLQAGNSTNLYVPFNTKRFFNVTDVKDNQVNLGSAVTSNPTEEAFYNIWFGTLDGTTEDCNIMVTLKYHVTFNEPKDLAQS